MTRWRHLALVSLGALPLLVVGLVMVAGEDLSPAWTVVLWVLGVLVLTPCCGAPAQPRFKTLSVSWTPAPRTRRVGSLAI